jgi:hypothetical protein
MMDRPKRYANVEYWNKYADWLEAENATLREVVHLFTDNDSVQVHQPFECEAAEAALENK